MRPSLALGRRSAARTRRRRSRRRGDALGRHRAFPSRDSRARRPVAGSGASCRSSSAATTRSPCPTSPACPSRGMGPGIGHPLRRARRHRRHPVRVPATGTAPRCDDSSSPARAAVTVSCRSDYGATGPNPRRWTGWPSRACVHFEMTEIVYARDGRRARRGTHDRPDDCDAVFLSVDVDVVDPGSAPGTGTPEPGGSRVANCSTRFGASRWRCHSAGVDVVEVSPPYDHAEITAYLGNRVVLEALGGVAWRGSR